jgi:hypothetical protein
MSSNQFMSPGIHARVWGTAGWAVARRAAIWRASSFVGFRQMMISLMPGMSMVKVGGGGVSCLAIVMCVGWCVLLG